MAVVWPMDLRKSVEGLERTGKLYRYLVDTKPFVREINIHKPVKSLIEVETIEKSETVGRWRDSWKDFTCGKVIFTSKRVGTLSNVPVPTRVILDDVKRCFAYIGKLNAMEQFLKNYKVLTDFNPALGEWALDEYKEFNQPCEKLSKYISVARKINKPIPDNAPLIYKREMDIRGVDSKFLESNKGIITTMYNALHHTQFRSHVQLWQALHIISAPEDAEFVQMRLMDPKYKLLGCETIRVYYPELVNMLIRPKNVFIVENKETYYHFPYVAESIVIFGHGLSVSGFLKDVPFIREADHIYYWSDLDTDGFRMLSNLRERYPRVESFMMDEEAIDSATGLIVDDTGSVVWEELPYLTKKEKQCFSYLSAHRYRLEQERIPWGYVLQRVKALIESKA